MNRRTPPCFTLDCLNNQFCRQLRYAVKLKSDQPRGSLILVDTLQWMEVYWVGRPRECPLLLSVIKEAIHLCEEPLAYNKSTVTFSPGTLCKQKHNQQADLLHPATVTIDCDNIAVATCEVQDLPPEEIDTKRFPWMEKLG